MRVTPALSSQTTPGHRSGLVLHELQCLGVESHIDAELARVGRERLGPADGEGGLVASLAAFGDQFVGGHDLKGIGGVMLVPSVGNDLHFHRYGRDSDAMVRQHVGRPIQRLGGMIDPRLHHPVVAPMITPAQHLLQHILLAVAQIDAGLQLQLAADGAVVDAAELARACLLQKHHLCALFSRRARRREAGYATADDDDVGFFGGIHFGDGLGRGLPRVALRLGRARLGHGLGRAARKPGRSRGSSGSGPQSQESATAQFHVLGSHDVPPFRLVDGPIMAPHSHAVYRHETSIPTSKPSVKSDD